MSARRAGRDVILWAYEPETIAEINSSRPNIVVPANELAGLNFSLAHDIFWVLGLREEDNDLHSTICPFHDEGVVEYDIPSVAHVAEQMLNAAGDWMLERNMTVLNFLTVTSGSRFAHIRFDPRHDRVGESLSMLPVG